MHFLLHFIPGDLIYEERTKKKLERAKNRLHNRNIDPKKKENFLFAHRNET